MFKIKNCIHRLVCIFFFCWFIIPLNGQNLRRLHLDSTDVVISDEIVRVFPRGFIYKLNEPDSVFYFGCISHDQEDVIGFVEKGIGYKPSLGHNILRVYGDFGDTIKIESIQDKLRHFITFAGNKDFILDQDCEYLILYYISIGIIDRHFVKNIRFFKKYSEAIKDKSVRLIVVFVD